MIELMLRAACSRIAELSAPGQMLEGVARVEPYDGQVNADFLGEMTRQLPAVFAAFQLGRAQKDRSRLKWAVKLNLVAVTRNLSPAPQSAALGSPDGGAGALALGELLAMALDGDKLGLEIEALEPEEIRTLVPGWLNGTKCALVGVQFATAFWTPRRQAGGIDPQFDDFLRVQSRLALGTEETPYTDLTETRS